MNKNYIIIAIILVVIIAGVILAISMQSPKTEIKSDIINTPIENSINNTNNQPQSEIKEFKMDSFYDNAGVWFSLKEIVVKKGDTVKIEVTNIKGMHDFVIDEYNISLYNRLDAWFMCKIWK